MRKVGFSAENMFFLGMLIQNDTVMYFSDAFPGFANT